jgi:hypothetical protein
MNKNTNTQSRIRRPLSCGSLVLALCMLAGNVAAAVLQPLESRLGGKAYFDPNLNITWAADADLVGETSLGAAQSAVDALLIEGISGWRLPSADRNGDGLAEDCKGGSVATCSTDNELSFMLNIRGVSAEDPDPFAAVANDWYWSASASPSNPPRVYAWLMNAASQSGLGDAHPDNDGLRTWAVRDGDVSVVPLPAAAWLFASAVFAAGIAIRRRKSA